MHEFLQPGNDILGILVTASGHQFHIIRAAVLDIREYFYNEVL